jgi:tetratricopeptide (TPR) repeat protein
MEQIYHDPLDSFTDREQIVYLFEQFLHVAQPGQLRILAIKGNSGTGKTFLISYLTTHILPNLGWKSGQLGFAQSLPDYRAILVGLEAALKDCVPHQSLQQYRDKRDEYDRSFDEYRVAITIHQNVEASSYSSLSSINQSVQVDAQLRERELHLRAELTRILVELAEESEHPLCLFLDSYERLAESDPELDGWLWEQVLLPLAKAAPQPIVVVTCGWEQPTNAAIQPFSQHEELTDFNEAQVRGYLEKQEIIAPTNEPLATEHQELVTTFYELTKGLPLVLGLAVTYFQQLSAQEQTAENLRAQTPLFDNKARVEFLEERLLSRLPEPHRILLERGPLLRFFDKETLQVLLSRASDSYGTGRSVLDDRTYARFLRYPFISQTGLSESDAVLSRPTFHALIRRVRLEALRQHFPDTKEQLHHILVDYFRQQVEAEQAEKQAGVTSRLKEREMKGAFVDGLSEVLTEIPEQEFNAWVEYFYHALQVRALQAEAFKEWIAMTGEAITKWRRWQARPLLEVVAQLTEEGEPFLSRTSRPYGNYLFLYSRYLEQEARLEEAQVMLETAVKVLEQADNPADLAGALNNLADLYLQQGNFKQALDYLERAVNLFGQVGELYEVALVLNNIGRIYQAQGEIPQALGYYERAMNLFERLGNLAAIATVLNNIGTVYLSQGEAGQALHHFEGALKLDERVGNLAEKAIILNNIGESYRHQEKLEQALPYYEQALDINKQVGNLAEIATSLNNMGLIYHAQREFAQALPYYERALSINEQLNNPVRIAATLDNIGHIYQAQGKWEQATQQYNEALRLYEGLGRGFEADSADELEALAACYGEMGEQEKSSSYLDRAQHIRKEYSQMPDDFPFSSVEEMKANYLWTNLRLGASQAFARHLVLLRHFDYINLSTREKRYLRQLREAVDELMQAWLTGPLPDVHQSEGELSEAGKRVAAILGREPFHKKNRELERLPPEEVYRRLHPKDSQRLAQFNADMTERFDSMKEQIIADLKELGKL